MSRFQIATATPLLVAGLLVVGGCASGAGGGGGAGEATSPCELRPGASCAPRMAPVHQERLSQSLQRLRPRFADELADGPLRVLLWIRVDETGRPGEIRIQERSRSAGFDRLAAQLIRTVRFMPARSEGRAVAVWLELPVTMTGS